LKGSLSNIPPPHSTVLDSTSNKTSVAVWIELRATNKKMKKKTCTIQYLVT